MYNDERWSMGTRELSLYPWSCRGVLLGNHVLEGQPTDEILSHFGQNSQKARASYLKFVADGKLFSNVPPSRMCQAVLMPVQEN